MSVPLRATGLCKRYGARALFEELGLGVAAGEVAALLGPNGTGKSTLLGCITGAVIADAGRVEIGGHDLETAPIAARAALRALPQEVEVPEGLTGRELLEFHAGVFADPSGQAAAIELADLGPAIDALATTYSVGMRKRLMFAALTLGPAALYVLDEPFAGVDREGRGRMVEALVRALARGAGVLLSAHDAEDLQGVGLVVRGIRLR
ncbi:MAG: ABC transporter ATP-binding protein [Nannocystis sp.]|nr:ABC transporter ATP-binding protein [Nannocystis sp.]MBA3550294.1 ABC transporter ATP-binding protein [Nannocystis sp.]